MAELKEDSACEARHAPAACEEVLGQRIELPVAHLATARCCCRCCCCTPRPDVAKLRPRGQGRGWRQSASTAPWLSLTPSVCQVAK